MADMTFRKLGESGLVVSVVGLGGNNFGRRLSKGDTAKVVDAAEDCGVNLIDTSDSYGESEEYLGLALEGRRENFVVATKFGSNLEGANGPDWGARASRRYVRIAIERSLRRLRTDYIDLYQLHRPDHLTPLEETLSVLDDLVHEGKVRYVGSSNFSGFEIAEAEWQARTSGTVRFVSAQNHYSLLERGTEKDAIPACVHYRIGMLPFFPLANGLLTGKYRRGQSAPSGTRLESRIEQVPPERFAIVENLEAFAAERGVTLLKVAIGGLAAMPAVSSVIAGATSPEQIRANAEAGTWSPSAEDLAELSDITAPA